ncbi:transmembrane protease serine 9 [Eurytemora carolleeae]|uniref:transmembrane protease serine 9 n=1 Tax=Eurytemora carolleeae TaxID=1294199 RepID=UPI000C772D6B|nr:transmembrane protease serine 9 [Eurytemora carolleeae]|eukprot:XP_023328925.1 transmembrane protease serine 9-like [Eurytemora affinis]
MEVLKSGFLFLFINLIAGFPFPEECGITYIEPSNIENATRHEDGKIVGGFEAVPGSWPWQAYLKYRGDFSCGGTLIHPEWVLSAGHCFHGAAQPFEWTIVLGEFDDTEVDGWEQTLEVSDIFVHPDYNNHDIDYDFTLIKLAKPVELNDHVAPACFPSEKDDLASTFPPGQVCIISGWGSINPEGNIWGPTLKQEYAQLWTNQECGEAYQPEWVTDRMVCAGFHLTGTEDPERCASLGFGDSGGPLVCRHPDTGRWTHVGATSWADFCYPDSYTPGVFASTINMRDWIVETLETNMKSF